MVEDLKVWGVLGTLLYFLRGILILSILKNGLSSIFL